MAYHVGYYKLKSNKLHTNIQQLSYEVLFKMKWTSKQIKSIDFLFIDRIKQLAYNWRLTDSYIKRQLTLFMSRPIK